MKNRIMSRKKEKPRVNIMSTGAFESGGAAGRWAAFHTKFCCLVECVDEQELHAEDGTG